MNLKGYIILFLLLLLIPVFIGKVNASQFLDLMKHPNWDSFKTAFSQLATDDFNYYKSLVMPLFNDWLGKLGDLIKGKIKDSL